LPERDMTPDAEIDWSFSCAPSGVAAFVPNHNSRLSFHNFPIPAANQIQADGVEVMFYCLRMGRCMLAAMAAGYQRMFARDASAYALAREGVGGKVINHDLPRLAIGRMLGGALQSRALSHLALQQDADGVDLAGLRDLTKSAAAGTTLRSLIACERVLGGRSFDAGSRVSQARANAHVFGVVEGEDDLILMGMVKDVTTRFVDRYMTPLLGVIQSINTSTDGQPLPREQRILRIGWRALRSQPRRCLVATARLLRRAGFWRLAGWIAGNALLDLARLPLALVPASMLGRYQSLPRELRASARYAERKLRSRRWTYLAISLYYQLELTRAQVPLQRFGKSIEHLVSMLVLCHHAALQDRSQQRIARLQAMLLRDEFRSLRIGSALGEMRALGALLDEVAGDVANGSSSLLDGIEPEPFAHPWTVDRKDRG
jgi:hypothetical protein